MRVRSQFRAPTIAFVATALLSTTALAAAPNPTLEDKIIRIHAGTDFLSFSHYNPDGGSNDGINFIGFGVGRPTGLDRNAGGPGFGGFVGLGTVAFGAGAILLNGHIALGGELAFTVDGIDVGEDTSNTLVLGRFTPYFNYMFGPFGRVKPWVGLRVGLGGSAVHGDTIDILGMPVDGVYRTIYPIVGVNGGAHIFVADSVSVDLGITFDYAAPHSKLECDGCNDDFDKDGDWINLSFPYAGLSAWF